MKKKREPIEDPRIVIAFLTLIALSVPWYLPEGSYEPVIWGFPYWVLVSLFFTVLLAVFCAWVINFYWSEE